MKKGYLIKFLACEIVVKTIAYIVAVSILSCTLHADELTKVRGMIRHYYEHKSTDNLLAFTDFIFDHYMCDFSSADQSSAPEHRNLPFKDKSSFTQHFSNAICADFSPHIVAISYAESIFMDHEPVFGSVAFEFFQPPQS